MRAKVILTIISAVLFLAAHPSSARTWYVKPDSTGDAPTVYAAMDAAASGDTVLVAAGTYYPERWLDLDLDNKYAWIVMTDGVSLVSESGPEVTTLVERSSGAQDYIIFGGLYYGGSLSATIIEGFRFTVVRAPGCMLGSHQVHYGRAIGVAAGDLLIRQNIIEGFEFGIEAAGGWYDQGARAGNHIIECMYGLFLYDSGPMCPVVENNTFEDCVTAIGGYGCSAWIVRNRILSSIYCGISLEGYAYCMMWNNTIIGTAGSYGIYAHIWRWGSIEFKGSRNPINGNNIYGNGRYDLYFLDDTREATFDATLNYWGSDCPDFEGRIYGPVDCTPWTDATHSRILTEEDCPGATEPTTWGSIKAMYR